MRISLLISTFFSLIWAEMIVFKINPSIKSNSLETHGIDEFKSSICIAKKSNGQSCAQLNPVCQKALSIGTSCLGPFDDCCENDSLCIAKSCTRLCPLSTLRQYCNADIGCDYEAGFICNLNLNRCSIPHSATVVKLGEKCDAKRFCQSGTAVCVKGKCESCQMSA